MIYETFLGIDPGLSGGLALLGKGGEVLQTIKMPQSEGDLLSVLVEFRRSTVIYQQHPMICVLEKAQAFPGQGVTSMFKYGLHYGSLRAMLIACRIPFEEVRPAIWQRAMGCLSRGDKNRTKAVAQQLFPGESVTHATADALLIAEYARRKYVG